MFIKQFRFSKKK